MLAACGCLGSVVVFVQFTPVSKHGGTVQATASRDLTRQLDWGDLKRMEDLEIGVIGVPIDSFQRQVSFGIELDRTWRPACLLARPV